MLAFSGPFFGAFLKLHTAVLHSNPINTQQKAMCLYTLKDTLSGVQMELDTLLNAAHLSNASTLTVPPDVFNIIYSPCKSIFKMQKL